MVNYEYECAILFFFLNEQRKEIILYHARSKYLNDFRLVKEANQKAEMLIEEKRHGATKLVGIAIARSEREYERIINRVQSGRFRFEPYS